MTILIPSDEDLLYPSGDGLPMAENTKQYQWIVVIKENLEILFAQEEQVFIAADFFWYPVQVTKPPAPRQAPDVMVIFGRPKGHRKSYRQWREDNIAPQVVFEILSDSNRTSKGRRDLEAKFRFYEAYGVEEYYIYDPDRLTLQGWERSPNGLTPISNLESWVSPRLGIRFAWQPGQDLQLFYPNGNRFLTTLELVEQLESAQQQADLAQQQAEVAQQQADLAQQQAEVAQEQARVAKQEVDQERQARLAAIPRLRSLGLTHDQIAEALGLSVDEVSESS